MAPIVHFPIEQTPRSNPPMRHILMALLLAFTTLVVINTPASEAATVGGTSVGVAKINESGQVLKGSWMPDTPLDIVAARTGTGLYVVQFGSGWRPQAGGVAFVHRAQLGDGFCAIQTHTNTQVFYRCYDGLGKLTDSAANVVVLDLHNEMWAAATRPTSDQYQVVGENGHNPGGGDITVGRLTKGRYTVKFDGATAAGYPLNNVVVSAVGSIAYCNAQSGATDVIVVSCFDQLGSSADAEFNLAVRSSGGRWAFADDPDATATYQPELSASPDGSGPMEISRLSVGRYEVDMNASVPVGAAVVTAVGLANTRCTSFSDNELSVFVDCRSVSGALTDSLFAIRYFDPRVPERPEFVQLVPGEGNSVGVTWESASDELPISLHRVICDDGEGGVIRADAGVLPVSLAALDLDNPTPPSGDVVCMVSDVNAGGRSRSASIILRPGGGESVITTVRAAPAGVVVDWRPAAEGPGEITGVRVQVSTGVPGQSPVYNRVHDVAEGKARVDGLEPDAPYVVSLALVSDAGEQTLPPKWILTLPASAGPCEGVAGYWLVEADGEQYAFGDAAEVQAPVPSGGVAVDIEASPQTCGTWTLYSDGTVVPAGGAEDLGSFGLDQLEPGEGLVTMSPTPTGRGLWGFTDRGRVLTLGDAVPKVGANNETDLLWLELNGPILDSVATPTGEGYIMLGSDGGIFGFGDAAFAGSVPGLGISLNSPAVGIVPDPDGFGYWIVAGDGGVFTFDADFRGSAPGALGPFGSLNAPIVGMVPYGDGYLQVAADGGVFNFSTLPFAGSLGSDTPDTPIVAITPIPVVD